MVKFIQLICYVSTCLLNGQSIVVERQLIGSTGQSSSIGNFHYDWSIGEVIIDQSNLLYLQGFQQYIDCPNIVTKKTNINYHTIITPGDNDKNNYLIFDNRPMHSELIIYDKWNTILFSKKEYDDTFDGISNSGKIIPDGVYIYLLLDELGNGIYKGTITIKRK